MTDIQVSKKHQTVPFLKRKDLAQMKQSNCNSNFLYVIIDRKSFPKANWNVPKLQEILRQEGRCWT